MIDKLKKFWILVFLIISLISCIFYVPYGITEKNGTIKHIGNQNIFEEPKQYVTRPVDESNEPKKAKEDFKNKYGVSIQDIENDKEMAELLAEFKTEPEIKYETVQVPAPFAHLIYTEIIFREFIILAVCSTGYLISTMILKKN